MNWKKERDQLQGILASERKMNNLLRKNCRQTRKPTVTIVSRGGVRGTEEAEKGLKCSMRWLTLRLCCWRMAGVRSVKGHDIDARA
ncbi:hypothetical protein ACLB1T_06830 [Escherichia coli]